MGQRACEGLDPELLQHIRECPCPCDHMGYGNNLDFQIPPCPPYPPLSRETSFNALPHPPPQFIRDHHYHQYHDVIRNYPHGLPRDIYYPYEYDSCSCSSGSDTNRHNLRGPWCICLVVCVVVATLTAGLGLPLALGPRDIGQLSQEERLELVKKLLKETPLIDGHNDLPWNLRKFQYNQLNQINLSKIKSEEPWSSSKWSHTDIPRLKEGGVGAQFWSAYVPCKSQHKDAVQITLEQIDAIERLVHKEQRSLGMAKSEEELRAVHKQGRIASLIGVEGGHALGNSLAVLRTFYNLGARYLTITHSCDISWATGQDTITRDGLSEFGKIVVKEMNRLGMIIDLSHSSVYTAMSAINVSSAPVIFSHSAAYTLCNSSRNVPDDVLKMVARNGGLVMVNFYAYHVACSVNATMDDVIRHINHIRKVAGIEHVGIGAGYDGINVTPSGLNDVSRYPHLFAELLADSDWSEQDILKLAGLNFLRVFKRVEEVRDEWKKMDVLPFEDLGPRREAQECISKNS
ncbi:dipeptidase 1-like [Anthonomus grandis grandis]|uniref:dipeptidase 1-like n=1 Tax=Anthonomus grandis grandis TaxID=2921223 RepID=UPI002165C0D4|nr:dipeptidase 1-like [Anthonomus grandis grandis]